MLTNLQERKLTRFFSVWDANGDGVITTEDPEQVARNLSKLQGLEPSSPEHKRFYNGFMSYQDDFLKAVDADESGRVTSEE
jgi:Ca2+-binding EF-hand superfamily protein